MADLSKVSGRIKFLIIDGYVAIPILITGFYPRKITLIFLVSSIITLYILELKGYPLPALLRKLRTIVTGRSRYIRPPWRKGM